MPRKNRELSLFLTKCVFIGLNINNFLKFDKYKNYQFTRLKWINVGEEMFLLGENQIFVSISV